MNDICSSIIEQCKNEKQLKENYKLMGENKKCFIAFHLNLTVQLTLLRLCL